MDYINVTVLTLTLSYLIRITCNFYKDVSFSYPTYLTNLYTTFITTVLSYESLIFNI